MIHGILRRFDDKFGFAAASAHCDVPCGIYDPYPAQIAALTVIRMVDLIDALEDSGSAAGANSMSRYVAEKEEHAKRVKDEIGIIWGDYIKAPQLEAHPGLHDLVHGIMMAASKAKQNVDRDAAMDLLNKVNQFAEIFWDTKGVSTYRATCPYAPAEETVYAQLS